MMILQWGFNPKSGTGFRTHDLLAHIFFTNNSTTNHFVAFGSQGLGDIGEVTKSTTVGTGNITQLKYIQLSRFEMAPLKVTMTKWTFLLNPCILGLLCLKLHG